MYFEQITKVLQAMILAEKGSCSWSRAVDATMGNGNDSLFLYTLLGGGLAALYAFDVQEEAIDNTRRLFLDKGYAMNKVHLIHDGHENIEKYVDGGIDVAMFNLGYLPKGDKSITTKDDTTVAAIDGLAKCLRSGGLIGIAAYTGHVGGKSEFSSVMAYIKSLDHRRFNIVEMSWPNRPKDPPHIILMKKI